MRRFHISLLLGIFIMCSCTNEYMEYHKDVFGVKDSPATEIKITSDFKVEDIGERDFEAYITPDKKVLDILVSKIDNAKKRIYLEVYILTEKRIIKALKDAKSRGIDVQIILEKNVFGAGNINKKANDSLTASGITVSYAFNSNYRFTHAKYFIIDDTYLISTGNMSFATFAYNKDILLFGSNPGDLKNLENIFQKDSIGEKFMLCDKNLVVSPSCPRSQFVKSLESAKKSVYVYAETFDDKELQELLVAKKKSGIDVRILLGDISKIKSNQTPFDIFKKSGIGIFAPKKHYVHAKVFIIDDDLAYVGSINFGTNSIGNNREIGIVFRNKDIIGKIKNEFLTNFLNMQ